MPKLTIHNVEVDFPKDPYPCQVNYMQKVLQALSNGSNALLESPTGTGKTLSLLCSTLAWQSHARKESKLVKSIKPSDPLEKLLGGLSDGGKGKKTSLPFTIIYCSRTHSQLTQVVAELRSTAYRPRTAVLGSREQLCVHEKVVKLPRLAVNAACQNLNNKRSCSYKSNLDGYQGAVEGVGDSPSPIYDIEELVKVGRRDNICPYYYSRDFSEYADIIFLPYNYLLDTSIRSTLNIRWDQSVVIFDEAHNIEKVASEAASFSLSSTEIATCIRELQQVLEYIQAHKSEFENKAKDAAENGNNGGASKIGNNSSALFGSSNGTSDPPTLIGVTRVLRAMFEFERRVELVPLTKGAVGDSTSCALPGDWMLKTLVDSGFEFAMAYKNIDELMRCSELLTHMAQDAFEGSIASIGSGSGTAAPSTEPKLTYFAYSLRRVFKGYNVQVSLDSARDYKVFICEDNSVPRTTYNQQTTITSFVTAKKRILNYWAFSPGIAMEELRELQVRSIILTSGTLSPLDSFKEDLKIPFLVELTNPHVIQKNQIWVGALPFGPSGKILNSSYNMRGKNEYKDELGMAVLSICETSRGFSFNNSRTYGGLVVPTGPDMKGGLLVFFPSYSVMENTVDRWKETNIFEKLESICCAVIIEPKGSSSANTRSQLTQKQSNSGQSSSSFNENKNWGASKKLSYEDDSATAKKAKVSFTSGPSKSTLPPGVGDADKEGQVAMGALIADFDAALAKHGNCMLMAVCRGKVSEGIDFSDSRGRVVIITGLPYTPFQDPWVVLKRQFLDESCFQQPSVQVAIPNTYAGYAQAVGSGSGSMGLLSMGQTKTTANPATGFRSAIRRLNGEAWYAQSASRAVNQAIGRVIRHKNDWGAIFFLDDRFVRSQQQAQLSGWVRPSTQNYEKISDALRNYRDFVNAALANPLLTIKPRVDVSALPKVDRRPLPPHKQHVDPAKEEESSAALTELFPQEVILRQDKLMQSSQFNSSDDNYFVNVDLLSQQVSSATPARCLPRNPVEELDGFLSKLSQSKVRSSLSRNGNIGVNTSGSLIAGKLTKSPKKSSIAHIFSVPASVKSTTASSSSSSDTVRRNLGHSNPRSTGGVSLYNLQGSSTSLSGRLSGASSGSFGLSSQSQNSLPSTLSQQSKPSSSESASQTQLPVKKQSFTLPTFERKQVLSIEQILQRTFEKLSSGLSSDLVDSLRAEMQKWRQAGAISQGDTAKECVDAFMSLVGATLPDLKVEENLLEILCAVCVAELRDEMKEYARKRFATISKREAKRVKLEGEAGNEYYNDGDQNYSTQNENAVDDASIQNHQIPLSQAARSILSSLENTGNNSNNTSISTSISSLKTARLWQPSVRAKQASQALQEVSSVRISTGANTTAAMAGKLSFQARLDDMRLKKDSDTSTKTGGPLQCGICKENKIVPCIAECGHVCCGPCWKSWIQKLEAVSKLVTCPLCRQTVNVDSIKRVKLM